MQNTHAEQVTATEQTQNKANEADQREKEAKQVVDKALRKQNEADVIIKCLESESSFDERELQLAVTTHYSALDRGDLLTANQAKFRMDDLRKVIATRNSKLAEARNAFSQAKSELTRTQGLHKQSETDKKMADQNLIEEKRKLNDCKTNWDKQITVKNESKSELEKQKTVVTTATNKMENVRDQLINSIKQQAQQRINVENIDNQLKEKTVQVTQLKVEHEALQSQQKEIQETKIVLNQAAQKNNQAVIDLNKIQDENKAKNKQVEETNSLVTKKQTELENMQSDYSRKEQLSHETKNKSKLIDQDLQMNNK